jgi:hypothetical protein
MTPDESAEKIRRRMAELRRELECDVREVGRSARVMTDWTFYVRRFPWAVAAVAAAAGFMLIPRKKEVIKPDPEMLAEMVKKQQVRVQPIPSEAQKQGILKPLLLTAITWAARAGAAYITQQLKEGAFKVQPQQPRQASRRDQHETSQHEPGASAVSESWEI